MKSHKSTDNKFFLHKIRLVLFFIFFMLAILAHRMPYFPLDLQISRWLQSFHQPLVSFVFNFVSEIGDDYHLVFTVGLSAAVLYFVGYRREAFQAVLATGFSTLIGTILKMIINRPRPTLSLVNIQESLSDQSFPSLHVLVFTVFFGYLLYLSLYRVQTKWLRLVIGLTSYFLVLTIGLSRIYLGAHWASDTLGGYLLGFLLLSYIITHAKR